MSPRSLALDGRLREYMLEKGLREHAALRALRAETEALEDGEMQSSPEQMQLLGLIIELMGATRVLEVGCFTGYGTLSMALALPAGGKVVTLDVNDQWAAIGRRYWREAGVEERIELRLGLAEENLRAMQPTPPFDLVYVDADKKGYPAYLDHALRLLRPGGLVALDNVFWDGTVADPDDQSKQVQALREVTRRLHDDDAVTPCLLPVGDGVMLARKRG